MAPRPGNAPRAGIPAASLASAVLALLATSCDRSESRPPAPGPVVASPDGEGPCPHPYFPIVEGTRWTYLLGDADADDRQRAEIAAIGVERRGSALSAELRRTMGNSTLTAEALCGRDGVSFLGAFFPLLPPLPSRVSVTPRITKRSGMLVPGLGAFRPNANWSYRFTSHTEARGASPITMDSEWEVEAHHLREQEITVAAGRYRAAQVRFVVSVHHRPPEEEGAILSDRMMDPPPMTFTYSLARGVGVVLIEGEPLPGRRERARWELVTVSVDRE